MEIKNKSFYRRGLAMAARSCRRRFVLLCRDRDSGMDGAHRVAEWGVRPRRALFPAQHQAPTRRICESKLKFRIRIFPVRPFGKFPPAT